MYVSLSDVPTIGVEEEFLLIDPVSRLPQPVGERVVAGAKHAIGELVSGEFAQCQLEVKTPPCSTAARLRAELMRLRTAVDTAAAAEGVRICASGTVVLDDGLPPAVGSHPRYRAGLAQYRAMMDDFALSALHVHVHLPDRDIAVLVCNHLRPWLPLLVALSANSPFYHAKDTGYASWRAVIRSRFPCLGPPPYAESLTHSEEIAKMIAASEAMLDAATPFWDVRLNPRLPTLEVRAMDVTTDVDDAVAVAVLIRALVTTATTLAIAGDPGPRISAEVLRSAYWRAARDGWCGNGVDAITGHILPTAAQLENLVAHVGAALKSAGDTTVVDALLDRLTARGTGAEMQRASAQRRGTLTDVVDDLMATTARR
ncbi:carboxylate-amine ligase [Mycolicibacterium tusciae]|uniref:carboxylate-amine ligase n=1 Tax=Mycolicibacterium tusciae TaxID=75922 RepID=UPI001F39F9FE|nr:glutamate--cysteine ligase [Mycolicibacterium tusciae]